MEDSGIVASTDSQSTQQQPLVKMPNVMQDSGICSDLLQRLSLDDGTASSIDVYYEPDEDGDVQLHLAVASGLADVVEVLVRMVPNPQLLSLQNNQGYSPLHIAVLQNQPAFARRLVVAGAKLDLKDDEGNTPLHLTARRGYVECAEALLRPIAIQESSPTSLQQQTCTHPSDLIEQRNDLGQYCVHLATMGGHVAYLQFLSWNGADMNALEGRGGRSALHLAVGARNVSLVQCLVEPKPTGCGVDPCLLDWYGRTPHQLSLMNGQSDIAALLASKGSATTTGGSSLWYEEASDSEQEQDIYNGPKWVSA